MQRTANILLLIASAILVGACVTLAPGADQVRLTNKPADVGVCKVLGNIQVPKNDKGLVDGASAQNQFRNQAVGLVPRHTDSDRFKRRPRDRWVPG